MKTLSVRQPYAEQIASGAKHIEYRSWPTSHRGPLLIVASKTGKSPHPQGVAICTVELVDCVKLEDGYGWKLTQPRRTAPVKVKGRLGLFDVDLPKS